MVAAVASVAGFIVAGPMAGPRFIKVKETTALRIPLADIAPGTGRFYSLKDSGRELRFVLARGGDGKVRSVFDACGQCYRYRKGFTIVGHELICRLCGNRYPIDHMMIGKASCAPVAISSQVKDGYVVVKIENVKKGSWLF